MRSILGLCCLAGLLIGCRGATVPSKPSTVSSAHDERAESGGRMESSPTVIRSRDPGRASPPPSSEETSPHAASEGAPSARGGRAARSVGVRGITGSLTAFEVEQAMNARTAALLACVKQRRPRALGHVAGDIAFHIALDGSGKVEDVVIARSDIGHAALEDCLAEVVATAPFPAPAGRERAETEWRMSVDPLLRPAQPIDGAELAEALKMESAASYESCQIAKGRRFAVAGYLGSNRKLKAVSVRVPWRAKARGPMVSPEQLTCLGEALKRWTHWPKARGPSKLSFELRWLPAPTPKRHVRGKRKVGKRHAK